MHRALAALLMVATLTVAFAYAYFYGGDRGPGYGSGGLGEMPNLDIAGDPPHSLRGYTCDPGLVVSPDDITCQTPGPWAPYTFAPAPTPPPQTPDPAEGLSAR